MRCSECNPKFTFFNRFKSMNKGDGRIQCNNCKSTFRKEKYRFLITIIVISIFFSDIISEWLFNIIDSRTTSLFIGGFIGLIVALMFILVSQNLCKYILVNK